MKINISRGVGYSMYRFVYPSDIKGIDSEWDVYTVYEPALARVMKVEP